MAVTVPNSGHWIAERAVIYYAKSQYYSRRKGGGIVSNNNDDKLGESGYGQAAVMTAPLCTMYQSGCPLSNDWFNFLWI
jgi:hypothetical protein